MPDLVITVTAAPPAIPCSASKLLVDTFTVSIVSAGETYIKWFGSQTFMFVAPSVRVELFVFACPLMLVAIDRAGVSVSALPNAIGIVPGARLISAWKLRNRLSGIVVMVSDLISVWTSALSVCSSSEADSTVTTSLKVPTSSVMSTRAIWPIVTGTFERTASRNPCKEIFTS